MVAKRAKRGVLKDSLPVSLSLSLFFWVGKREEGEKRKREREREERERREKNETMSFQSWFPGGKKKLINFDTECPITLLHWWHRFFLSLSLFPLSLSLFISFFLPLSLSLFISFFLPLSLSSLSYSEIPTLSLSLLFEEEEKREYKYEVISIVSNSQSVRFSHHSFVTRNGHRKFHCEWLFQVFFYLDCYRILSFFFFSLISFLSIFFF